MTFKQFKKALKEIISIKEDTENLNKAIKKLEPDAGYLIFSRHETLMVELLKIACNDSEWIDYFLYEMNGKFSKKKNIVIDGKKFAIEDYNDLWTLINK